MKHVPLQLKLNNFSSELHTFVNNNGVMSIYNDDKKFFRKCREIWNKTIELKGISNPGDFAESTLDDDADEFIMADVYKNTSFVEGNCRDKFVIVLHFVTNHYLRASVVQCRY